MQTDSKPIFTAANPMTIARLSIAGKEPEWSYSESLCVLCGVSFRFRYLTAEKHETPSRCILCHDRELAASEEKNRADEHERQRKERRQRNVPPIYADNETGRFPAAWPAVSQWRPRNGHGLGLIGPSGKCKTRMVYERLMDLRENENTRFLALSSFQLQRAIQHQWNDDACKALLRRARSAGLLFIDDLGKQKFTEAAEAELFDILEERTSYRRSVVFTSNLTGADLETLMSDNVGGPFLRRLREFCEIHVVQ